MLITITSSVGIFNVSDVKPELKATENIFFVTLPNVNYISNDSINDSINDLGLEILKTTEYSTHSEPHRPALRATYSII